MMWQLTHPDPVWIASAFLAGSVVGALLHWRHGLGRRRRGGDE